MTSKMTRVIIFHILSVVSTTRKLLRNAIAKDKSRQLIIKMTVTRMIETEIEPPMGNYMPIIKCFESTQV